MTDKLREDARRVWRLLHRRESKLAQEAATVIAKAMQKINELENPPPVKKRGELHPLHRRLILCCQSKIVTKARDSKEDTAFKRVLRMELAEDDIAALERFYRVRKSEKVDETWNRKTTPTILMNNISTQLDLAHTWCDRNKPKPREVDTTPPEPEGWRQHAPGAFQDEGFSSWFGFWRDYPDEAKRVLREVAQ